LWTAGREDPSIRFIIEGDQAVTDARLMLVKATSLVIRTGLNMLSITALEEM
jgi:arginyl-tRNA synthetase